MNRSLEAWLLVAGVVGSTIGADLLQSAGMKKTGAITDLRPTRLGRVWVSLFARRFFLLSIVFMAASFFCFLRLLEAADLSFAVPATAASIVIETMLAQVVLKERVNGLRWAGSLCVAVGVWLLAA